MYPTVGNLAFDATRDDASAPDLGTRARSAMRAAEVQRSWLPRTTVEATHAVIACHSTSVNPCGGDLCAIYPLGEALLVVIGDVTGHHYDAALTCALAKGACDVAVNEIRPLSPTRLLEVLDRTLRRSTGGRMAMSCAVALVASRTMTVASAGHPLPYVVRDHGDRIEGVRSFGSLLGTDAPATYQTTTVPLRPGDRVLWYTDGVLDMENEAGARFGHRRVRALLQRAQTLGAASLVEALAAELFWFRGDAAPKDDATFAVAEIR